MIYIVAKKQQWQQQQRLSATHSAHDYNNYGTVYSSLQTTHCVSLDLNLVCVLYINNKISYFCTGHVFWVGAGLNDSDITILTTHYHPTLDPHTLPLLQNNDACEQDNAANL